VRNLLLLVLFLLPSLMLMEKSDENDGFPELEIERQEG
jgi:hypothetical protein